MEKIYLKGAQAFESKQPEKIFSHTISSIVITTDDKFLFISSKIGELVQYSNVSNCVVKIYEDIPFRIHCMKIKGNFLFASSDFGNVISIDIKNQKKFSNLTLSNCQDLKCIAVTNNEETLFVADSLGI